MHFFVHQALSFISQSAMQDKTDSQLIDLGLEES